MIHALLTQATLPDFFKVIQRRKLTPVIFALIVSLFLYIHETKESPGSRCIRSAGHRIIFSTSSSHKAITVNSQLTSLLEEASVYNTQNLDNLPVSFFAVLLVIEVRQITGAPGKIAPGEGVLQKTLSSGDKFSHHILPSF